jgi:hypothetical protein
MRRERYAAFTAELCPWEHVRPTLGQRGFRGVPHSMQNFISSGVSPPQRGHCIGAPSCMAVQAARGAPGQEPRRPALISAY